MEEQAFFTLVTETLQDLEHSLDEADHCEVLSYTLLEQNLTITLPSKATYSLTANIDTQCITLDSPFSGMHQSSYNSKFKSWIVDDQRVNMEDFVFFELRQFLIS